MTQLQSVVFATGPIHSLKRHTTWTSHHFLNLHFVSLVMIACLPHLFTRIAFFFPHHHLKTFLFLNIQFKFYLIHIIVSDQFSTKDLFLFYTDSTQVLLLILSLKPSQYNDVFSICSSFGSQNCKLYENRKYVLHTFIFFISSSTVPCI